MQDQLQRLFLAVLFGVLAVPLTRWAGKTAQEISKKATTTRLMVSVLIVVSFVTGWMLWGTEAGSVATVVIAWVLLVVQGVLDVATRRLSRPVTVVALLCTLGLIAFRATNEGGWTVVVDVALVGIVVVVVFWILHWSSRESLGLGDVLLVAPLSLLLGSVNPRLVMFWLVLSSMTGAIHASLVRRLRGEKGIPFGPHLLFGAWLLLMISV